jgi:hypothetical protein
VSDPQEHGETADVGSPIPPPAPLPLNLDYFAEAEPDARRARSIVLWWLCLVLGWVPYLCGIVNVLVVAQAYSSTAVTSHTGGAVLFMSMGIVLSVASVVAFVRHRHWAGLIAALLVLAAQVSVSTCLGLGGRWLGAGGASVPVITPVTPAIHAAPPRRPVTSLSAPRTPLALRAGRA